MLILNKLYGFRSRLMKITSNQRFSSWRRKLW